MFRFILANTEALHEKITLLANRVRQLEDGLAEAHSHNSHTPHPLLSEDLLQIKRPLERERQDVPQVDEKPETEDTIDSLGSLCVRPLSVWAIRLTAHSFPSSISNDGRSTFFGQTANSWVHLFSLPLHVGTNCINIGIPCPQYLLQVIFHL